MSVAVLADRNVNRERSKVPCNGCRACCSQAVFMRPQDGDIATLYETVEGLDPISGKWTPMLRMKPNGECHYLGPDGCTIYDHAPAMCRVFDCRRFFLRFTRNDRRRLVREGLLQKEVMDAGQARLHTLEAVGLESTGENERAGDGESAVAGSEPQAARAPRITSEPVAVRGPK